jgi:ribosomal protein S19
MDYITIKDYDRKSFSINKFNELKYNILYKSKNFYINPKIASNNCKIWHDKDPYKVKLNINMKDNEEIDFENLINVIVNEVNVLIKKNRSINSILVNPLIDSNIDMDIKILYLTIANYTIFKDYETKEKLDVNDLLNKTFIIYPLIYSPTINIYNQKVYINFILKQALIKFHSFFKFSMFYNFFSFRTIK